jgi:hypothetical protein
MDKGAGLVVEGFAVVDVECSRGVAVFVQDDDEREGVVSPEAGGAAGTIAAGDDVAALHEKRDFVERGGHGVVAGARIGGVVEVVVVGLVVGDVDGDAVCAFFGHRLSEETGGADVELIVDGEASFIFGVNVEVGSDDGCTGGSCLVESSVPGRK